ncbi:MAG TPA: response regulator transcription factor [Gaiellaceae bacterium]|nr:response regulator transcription factor [Gaiellaceae bacterium]
MTAGRTIRLVVADDEPQVRNVLVRLFEEEGFAGVGAACDGVEVAKMALTLAPDVVLVDVRMPNLGGIEATGQIHARQPDVRIVVLSAYEDPALKDEAQAAGASAFLVKRCPAAQLLDAVCA